MTVGSKAYIAGAAQAVHRWLDTPRVCGWPAGTGREEPDA